MKIEEHVRALLSQLGEDPERNGQQLSEGLYRLVVSPLVVFYEIHNANLVVSIRSVGHFRV